MNSKPKEPAQKSEPESLTYTVRIDSGPETLEAIIDRASDGAANYVSNECGGDWNISNWSREQWRGFLAVSIFAALVMAAGWGIARQQQVNEGCTDERDG